MYHKSQYNYIYKKTSNLWVIYNTFTGAIITIDNKLKKEFSLLDDYKIENNSNFIQNLIKQGILVDNRFDEKMMIDASRARRTYGEKSAYLRILTTTACNARCDYCYEKGFKTTTMNEKTANDVINYINKLPTMDKFYIHWFGGEPLLNTNVIDQIMDATYNELIEKGTKVFVYFTSNGSLLNKKMIKKAKNVWHATYFQITLDDLGEEYDKIKKYLNKKYNYENVEKNIKYLLEEQIKVVLRINYYPNEISKVKKIIDKLSSQFLKYIKSGLLVFDPAPIFETTFKSCLNCNKVYNMSEPAMYLIDKELATEDDALNLKFKGGQCYACHQGSFVISPTGNLYKCTVTMNDECAKVGNVVSGIERNKYYFKWVNPELPKKCDNCVFYLYVKVDVEQENLDI